MADYAVAAHILATLPADMPDIVEERRQHHFIVEALGHGQLRGLGHVFDLRDRLSYVIGSDVLFVQREDFGDHLLSIHHASPHSSVILPSASAGPTLMPTPVCIKAALTPSAARRNENGPGPREP